MIKFYDKIKFLCDFSYFYTNSYSKVIKGTEKGTVSNVENIMNVKIGFNFATLYII